MPKVVKQRCLEQDLNPQPTDRKPKCLTRCTTAPPQDLSRQCKCIVKPHLNRFTALFPGPPSEPVPEENLRTSSCKGRLTETDTQTIRLGTTPSGLTSATSTIPPFCKCTVKQRHIFKQLRFCTYPQKTGLSQKQNKPAAVFKITQM